MKNIENYLDDLKGMTGSDYQSAIALKVDRSVISKMRSRSAISDENAVKLAELIGVDAGEVLLAAALARSKGAVKDAWQSVGKRAGIGNGSEENVYYVKFIVIAAWLDFCALFGSFHMESKKWHDQKRAIFTSCVGIV
jgi:hypothetical protein